MNSNRPIVSSSKFLPDIDDLSDEQFLASALHGVRDDSEQKEFFYRVKKICDESVKSASAASLDISWEGDTSSLSEAVRASREMYFASSVLMLCKTQEIKSIEQLKARVGVFFGTLAPQVFSGLSDKLFDELVAQEANRVFFASGSGSAATVEVKNG